MQREAVSWWTSTNTWRSKDDTALDSGAGGARRFSERAAMHVHKLPYTLYPMPCPAPPCMTRAPPRRRTVVGSEALGLGGGRWSAALEQAVVPLVAQLAGALAARSRPDAAIERTLRAAVLLLCKALLQARRRRACALATCARFNSNVASEQVALGVRCSTPPACCAAQPRVLVRRHALLAEADSRPCRREPLGK